MMSFPYPEGRPYDVFEVDGQLQLVKWASNTERAEPVIIVEHLITGVDGKKFVGTVYSKTGETPILELDKKGRLVLLSPAPLPHQKFTWTYRPIRRSDMRNVEAYKGFDIFEDNDGWWAGHNEPDGWACHGPHASREAAMEWVDAQSEGREDEQQPDGDPELDRAAQAAFEEYQNSDHRR